MNNSKQSPLDLTVSRLFDGAMGTEMLKRGWSYGSSLERWANDNSDQILALHRDYIEAGAEIISTCTFGANRIRLAEHGTADDISDLNWSLVRMAHQVKAPNTLIAGCIGPTGDSAKSGGNLDRADLKDIFREQIEAIADAKVDLISIETLTDLDEALAALAAARELTDCPVAVTMAFNNEGRLKDLLDAASACERLQDAGAAVVGCNCSPSGVDLLRVVEEMLAVARVPLLVQPSAGTPVETEGSLVYPLGVEAFGDLVGKLSALGVTLIGGCCGTTPEYIRSIHQETGVT